MERWVEAKEYLDNLDFPDVDLGKHGDDWRNANIGELHGRGRSQHELQTFFKNMEMFGFDVKLKFNYCPTCDEVRNKRMAVFNNQKGVVYERIIKQMNKKGNANERSPF